MKYNCKVIQDLLPLYTDGICSDVSAQIVEEHLKECASCEKIAKELQDDSVEKTLGKECDHVVLSHEKKVSKKMVTAGSITAAVLLIPVIVCLICNLAIGHALDWFFIVLTALLVVASVTLVPMLVVEKKAVYTVLAFTGTLVLFLHTRKLVFRCVIRGCFRAVGMFCTGCRPWTFARRQMEKKTCMDCGCVGQSLAVSAFSGVWLVCPWRCNLLACGTWHFDLQHTSDLGMDSGTLQQEL